MKRKQKKPHQNALCQFPQSRTDWKHLHHFLSFSFRRVFFFVFFLPLLYNKITFVFSSFAGWVLAYWVVGFSSTLHAKTWSEDFVEAYRLQTLILLYCCSLQVYFRFTVLSKVADLLQSCAEETRRSLCSLQLYRSCWNFRAHGTKYGNPWLWYPGPWSTPCQALLQFEICGAAERELC